MGRQSLNSSPRPPTGTCPGVTSRWVTATIGTLAGKQTDPVGPPRTKRNCQAARSPVKRTPFDTTLLGRKLALFQYVGALVEPGR